MDQELIGVWYIDPTDAAAVKKFGSVSMEFMESGKLTYTIHAADRDQIMYLTFEASDGELRTDQPSSPKTERTEYEIKDDVLYMEFNGTRARFIRSV